MLLYYPNYHQKSAKSQKTLVDSEGGPHRPKEAKVYDERSLENTFLQLREGKKCTTNPSFLALSLATAAFSKWQFNGLFCVNIIHHQSLLPLKYGLDEWL